MRREIDVEDIELFFIAVGICLRARMTKLDRVVKATQIISWWWKIFMDTKAPQTWIALLANK